MGASRWLDAPLSGALARVPTTSPAVAARLPARARGCFTALSFLLWERGCLEYARCQRSDQWSAAPHLYSGATRMDKQHLTWTQIEDLAIRLADQLPTDYDVMLVITRGGMVPACIISERLNLRNI